MPHGGTLRFTTEAGRDGRVLHHACATPAPASRPSSWRGSSTSTSRPRRGGSGIGLSMVFRTVQLHDGDIDVESTPGTGTTFTIALPRRRP